VVACGDCNAQLIITVSAFGHTSRYVSKYRPAVPQIVVTDNATVANQACVAFGQYALLVESLAVPTSPDTLVPLLNKATALAKKLGLWAGEGAGIVVYGRDTLSADRQPVLRVMDLADLASSRLLGKCSVNRAFNRVA
jgi:pyruvate kinase